MRDGFIAIQKLIRLEPEEFTGGSEKYYSILDEDHWHLSWRLEAEIRRRLLLLLSLVIAQFRRDWSRIDSNVMRKGELLDFTRYFVVHFAMVEFYIVYLVAIPVILVNEPVLSQVPAHILSLVINWQLDDDLLPVLEKLERVQKGWDFQDGSDEEALALVFRRETSRNIDFWRVLFLNLDTGLDHFKFINANLWFHCLADQLFI